MLQLNAIFNHTYCLIHPVTVSFQFRTRARYVPSVQSLRIPGVWSALLWRLSKLQVQSVRRKNGAKSFT